MKGAHQIKAFNLWNKKEKTKQFNKVKENRRKVKGIDWSCHFFSKLPFNSPKINLQPEKLVCYFMCLYMLYSFQGWTPTFSKDSRMQTWLFDSRDLGIKTMFSKPKFWLQIDIGRSFFYDSRNIFHRGEKNKIAINYVIALGNVMLG